MILRSVQSFLISNGVKNIFWRPPVHNTTALALCIPLNRTFEWFENFASVLIFCTSLRSFLGPRGPLVLPLVDPRVCPSMLKIWITYIYRHICLMNHQKTHQTNPMAPWNPLDAPLDPLGPLNRSLRLIELLISPQLPYKSSAESSNVAADSMGHLTLPPWTPTL